MLRLPVLAADITNLTDARYFAAWYVDYMSFCMGEGSASYVTPQQVKEIVAWVEGPQYLLQFKSRSTDTAYVEWMMETTEVSGAISGYRVPVDIVAAAEPVTILPEIAADSELPLSATALIITEPSIDWRAIMQRSGKPVYLDYDFSMEEVSSFVDMDTPPGLVVRGGEEEKVGLKSYDDLDELFDLLME